MSNKNIFKLSLICVLAGLDKVIALISRGLEKLLIFLKRKEYLGGFKERKDDIYIASFMESGATWIQVILHQLTSDGNMDFRHIYDISPTLETELMKIAGFDFEQLPSPRFIKTHLPYKMFLRKPKGKLIYIMRDGREVAVALYHHAQHVNKIIDFDRVFNEYFLKLYDTGWFGHLADWLTNKRKYNILYIKYEGLLNDLEGNIRKIIDFCGFKVDESQLQGILERSGFDFLEKHQEKLKAFNHPDASGNIEFSIEFNDFIKERKITGSHEYFSEEQNKKYADRFDKFLSFFNLDYDKPASKSDQGSGA